MKSDATFLFRLPACLRRPRGFTVFELLLVVLVIGVLSAVAMPSYQDYIQRAQVAEALTHLGEARQAVSEFYGRWGRFPASNAEAGLAPADQRRGRHVRRLTVQDGVIVAEVPLGPEGRAQLYTLSLRPAFNAQYPHLPLQWLCGHAAPTGLPEGWTLVGAVGPNPLDSRLLPNICRAS